MKKLTVEPTWTSGPDAPERPARYIITIELLEESSEEVRVLPFTKRAKHCHVETSEVYRQVVDGLDVQAVIAAANKQ